MGKLRVTTVVGTRPEIIRLSRIINCLDKFCDHTLVHTGQNFDYELNEIFFKELCVRKPDYFLNAASSTPCSTIGKIISGFDSILEKNQTDAVFVLGDTNSCLSLYAAKRRQIPTFHMEAGNRCFDQRVPEEINRKLVDHIADINLTYGLLSKNYLVNEGIKPDTIIKVGSPMYEVLSFYKKKIDKSKIVNKLKLKKNKFFLLSVHREENIDNSKNFRDFENLIRNLENKYKLPLIISTHPRTKKKIDEIKKPFSKNILFLNPLGFFDYIKLQLSAKVVLSDSGTISEESSILQIPAVNLRETHERPEAMEEATVIMTGIKFDRVKAALDVIFSQNYFKKPINKISDYFIPNVSTKLVRIIYSYTDYVNKFIWKKF